LTAQHVNLKQSILGVHPALHEERIALVLRDDMRMSIRIAKYDAHLTEPSDAHDGRAIQWSVITPPIRIASIRCLRGCDCQDIQCGTRR
jgi:hypothetical protein